MKPGFYISMGIAIAALAVGFILLNDIQQEQVQTIWLQKTPTQCNDVWQEEYNEFFKINPEIRDIPKEKSKEILESIIKPSDSVGEVKLEPKQQIVMSLFSLLGCHQTRQLNDPD